MAIGAQSVQTPQPLHPRNATLLFESMQAVVNGVLVEVGCGMKDFRRPMRYNMSISAMCERFHQSLDVIDQELFRAKAALRRDLAVKREEREKREWAEQEQRKAAGLKQEADEVVAAAPASTSATGCSLQEKEANMVDVSATAPSNLKLAAATPSVAAHTHHPPPRLPAIETQAHGNTASQSSPATANTDELFGRTPITAGAGNNASFNSMFEALTASKDNGNGGDASMCGVGNNAKPTSAPFVSIKRSADGHANKNAASQLHIEVVESNVDRQEPSKKKRKVGRKQSKDETAGVGKEQERGEETRHETLPVQKKQELPDLFGQAESTFDDLFNYTEFDASGTGGTTRAGDTTFDQGFFNT